MLRTAELFDLSALPAWLRELIDPDAPWVALARMDRLLADLEDRREGRIHPSAQVDGPVFLAPDAHIGPGAWVVGPAWIGPGAEVGHAAVVRGGSVLAAGSKVGHASEVKRSLLLPGAKVPHFNYVGDSILGSGVNLGAGVKLANFKNDGGEVRVDGEGIGLRKFGAAVGDGVAIGCNAVLMPGTILGARSVVYSGVVLRGVVPADTVVKLRQPLQHDTRS